MAATTEAQGQDTFVLSASKGGKVQVWKYMQEGKLEASSAPEMPNTYCWAMTALSNGKVACGFDKELHILSLTPEGDVTTDAVLDNGGGIRAIVELPGNRLAAGSGNDVKLWSWGEAGWKEGSTLTGHTAAVRALLTLPDGRLASAGGAAVFVWEEDGSSAQHELGEETTISALGRVQGGLVAVGLLGNQRPVRLLDPANGKFESSPANGNCCVAMLARESTVTGHTDAEGTMFKTELFGEMEDSEFLGHGAPRGSNTPCVMSIALLPDGHIVTGASDNRVRVWGSSSSYLAFTGQGVHPTDAPHLFWDAITAVCVWSGPFPAPTAAAE